MFRVSVFYSNANIKCLITYTEKKHLTSFVVVNQINYPSFNEDWYTGLHEHDIFSTFMSTTSKFFDPSFWPFYTVNQHVAQRKLEK